MFTATVCLLKSYRQLLIAMPNWNRLTQNSSSRWFCRSSKHLSRSGLQPQLLREVGDSYWMTDSPFSRMYRQCCRNWTTIWLVNHVGFVMWKCCCEAHVYTIPSAYHHTFPRAYIIWIKMYYSIYTVIYLWGRFWFRVSWLMSVYSRPYIRGSTLV